MANEARQQAQAERLTLVVAENKAGYFGVTINQSSKSRPYQAKVTRGGEKVYLGSFATAEEAALCFARSPEGHAAAVAAERPTAAVPLTSEEVRQQAQAEGLTLRAAANKTGFFCVYLKNASRGKPFVAELSRSGSVVSLGTFATAEEAALYVARSPEGRAAAAPPRTSEEVQTRLWDARTIRAVALDIIYEAAGAATAELSAEVAAEVMAGIALGL